MAYSFQTFTLSQVLTAAQMNQVEVNIRDHVHGAAGVVTLSTAGYAAASVDQAAIGASVVGQGELKTTTAAGSTSLGTQAGGAVALTGGTYSWWTASADTVGSASSGFSFGGSAGVGYDLAAGTIGLFNLYTDTKNFYRDERYVQASPPYTHGPLFVFLMLDALGNIVNIEVAPDPTWAYHGPTDIRPQQRIGGKPYRKVPLYDGKTWNAVLQDPALLRAVMASQVLPVLESREITLAYKDSDMSVVPHPWCYNKPEYFTGRTVVLLEPGTNLMLKLFELLDAGHAHDVRKLIADGYLVVNNLPITLPTQPPGVQVVRAAWKQTP